MGQSAENVLSWVRLAIEELRGDEPELETVERYLVEAEIVLEALPTGTPLEGWRKLSRLRAAAEEVIDARGGNELEEAVNRLGQVFEESL